MSKFNLKKLTVIAIIAAMVLGFFPWVGSNVSATESSVNNDPIEITEEKEDTVLEAKDDLEVPIKTDVVDEKVEVQEAVVSAKLRVAAASVNVPGGGQIIIKDAGAYDLVDAVGNVTTPGDTLEAATIIQGSNFEIVLQNSQELTVNRIDSSGNVTVTGSGNLKASSTSLRPINVAGKLTVNLSNGVLTGESQSPGTPYSYGVYVGSLDVLGGTLSGVADACVQVDGDVLVSGANSKISGTITGSYSRRGLHSQTGHITVENNGIVKVESQGSNGGTGMSCSQYGSGYDITSGGQVLIGVDSPSTMSSGITGASSAVLTVSGAGSKLDVRCTANASRGIDVLQSFVKDGATVAVDSGYEGFVVRHDLQVTNKAVVDVVSHGHHGIYTNLAYNYTDNVAPGIYVDDATVSAWDTGSTWQESFGIINRAGGFVVQNGGHLEGRTGNGINESVLNCWGLISYGGTSIIDNGTVIGDASQMIWANGKFVDGAWISSDLEVKNGGTLTGTGSTAGIRAKKISVSQNSEVVGVGDSYGITATGASVSDTANIMGIGDMYGFHSNGNIEISGGTLKGSGANNQTGAGVNVTSGNHIISTGGHLIGESKMATQMGVRVASDITISNKGIVEGFTPAFGDGGTPTAYSAVQSKGTLSVSGEGQVIENYTMVENFTDTYIDPAINNPNVTAFNNYTWQVGEGLLEVDDSLGVRGVTSIPGQTTLRATRVDGSGELISLSGKSSHIINYYATVKGVHYQLSFDLNGGNVQETPKTQLLKAGALATEPVKPVREGYKFLGWKTSESSSYWAFDKDQMPASDVILYAQWEKVTAGGGDGNQKPGTGQGAYRIPKTGGYGIIASALVLLGTGVLLIKRKKDQ